MRSYFWTVKEDSVINIYNIDFINIPMNAMRKSNFMFHNFDRSLFEVFLFFFLSNFYVITAS